MTLRRLAIEQRRDGQWRVRAVYDDGTRRAVGVYPTREDAEDAARSITSGDAVTLIGASFGSEDTDDDVGAVWQRLIDEQQQRLREPTLQRVILPSAPCAVAFLSDLHIGNAGTDYAAIRRDAEIVAATEGMYATFVGDGIDNWIIGKLAGLQRGQAVAFDDEWRLLEAWLRLVSSKLLVVVAGNHDNWTTKLAGIDRLRDLVQPLTVLYHAQQVVFSLQIGETTRTVCVRHRWRGSSVFNVTHGLEVSWERMGLDYDWSIGGHTHIATVCRPFLRHGILRHAILIGTYKLADHYAAELGLAPSHGSGSGAMVLHPDGRQWWFDKLSEASSFLSYLRKD